MSEPTQAMLVERARDTANRGEWQQAYDLLIEADERTPLATPDLAFLANAAYAAGHLDVTIGAWERAHALAVHAGDRLSAAGAAVRIAMHLLFDTALMAPVRGWTRRAERLLEGYDETPVHAWLAVVRGYERLLSGDFHSARTWARLAIEVGTKCDAAAAALGRVAEARSLILGGEVAEGLALLDDAAVAAVSGELEPLLTGVVYCEVVCALQAAAQYDLAEEWTAAMERWHHGQPVGSIHGRCRVHRAEILRLRGSCADAEVEALGACEELRPYLRRELGWPLTELGRIRLHRGDIEGAEAAFMAAHELGWDPQPGLALAHLARGEVTLAARSIWDALEHPSNVASKELPPNTELRRAPLLEAQVEIAVEAGDLDVARAAADELARIAERFESKALTAGAALARGRVRLAEADVVGARGAFEEAAHLWNEVGAPYETALARMEMAHAYRAEGHHERAMLELRAARSGFERVGAVDRAAEAGRAGGGNAESDDSGDAESGDVQRGDVQGGDARERDPQRRARSVAGVHAAEESVFRREGDYWSVTFEGTTVRLRDVKGLRYLARLLAAPGRELHVLDLVAAERGWSDEPARGAERRLLSSSTDLHAGTMLDAQAKAAYKRRLAEIDEDMEEAQELGDDERATQAAEERDFLVRELARAVGLGGRDRRAGSAAERARASVTRAIRQAMTRVRTHHPALGAHLDRAIHTGAYCAYRPDPRVPIVWRV